jgi:hypothetical protein
MQGKVKLTILFLLEMQSKEKGLKLKAGFGSNPLFWGDSHMASRVFLLPPPFPHRIRIWVNPECNNGCGCLSTNDVIISNCGNSFHLIISTIFSAEFDFYLSDVGS